MKQGPYLSGPVAKARFPQPASNMDAPKQILSLDRTAKADVTDPSRLSHAEKLNQVRELGDWREGALEPGRDSLDPSEGLTSHR